MVRLLVVGSSVEAKPSSGCGRRDRGVTVRGEPNSYLCTEKAYGDFELELEFRVEDNRLNSGVQVRSQSFPEFQKGIVHGHQIEIDPTDRGWTGAIYDEARDGWLAKPKPGEDSSKVFRLGQWNALRIVCRGTRITTWLNEVQVVDFQNASRSGLHRSANAFNLGSSRDADSISEDSVARVIQ